jgi:hypothetical protein
MKVRQPTGGPPRLSCRKSLTNPCELPSGFLVEFVEKSADEIGVQPTEAPASPKCITSGGVS